MAKQVYHKLESIEQKLIKHSESIRSFIEISKNNSYNVEDKLKTNEAIIDFTYFRYFNGKKFTNKTHYCALILRKNKKPQIEFLFEEQKVLEILAVKGYINVKNYINDIYSYLPNKNLFDILWNPLENKLIGVNIIFISPSGILHKITFNAIQCPDKQYLFEATRQKLDSLVYQVFRNRIKINPVNPVKK